MESKILWFITEVPICIYTHCRVIRFWICWCDDPYRPRLASFAGFCYRWKDELGPNSPGNLQIIVLWAVITLKTDKRGTVCSVGHHHGTSTYNQGYYLLRALVSLFHRARTTVMITRSRMHKVPSSKSKRKEIFECRKPSSSSLSPSAKNPLR